MTPEYRFILHGKTYSFPSEKKARVEAFRLTGKIGAVTIYKWVPSPSDLRRERRTRNIVRIVIVVLLALIVGLVINTRFVIDAFEVVVAFISADWPIILLFVGVVMLAALVEEFAEKHANKRLEEEDDFDPPMGGAA
jgi:uncharacterized integral membrane protein